jgi:vesicle transport protein SEC22
MAEAKGQAKMIFKKLSDQSEPRCTIESGTFTFQQLVSFRSNTLSYLIENGVCYLCVCDRSYPRKLAFSYLEELAKEFDVSYGQEVMKPGLRPYAFIKFGTTNQPQLTR